MKVTVRIKRFNPEVDERPHFETYHIEAQPETPLLDCLHDIKWRQDGSLSFRRSCGHAICGSCAMTINGLNRLACQTLVKDVGAKMTIEPLRSFPVVRDLIVDLDRFYEKVYAIMPWFINNSPPPDRERIQWPEDQMKINEASSCILCASCTSSCPSFWADDDYLGPAAMLKAFRFIFDTRDQAQIERLQLINTNKGPWKCHTIFNCNEACPKDINITDAIAQLKLKLSTP
jgi:succinate dehydrogenase / fumarate reductase, iron-sulfur subunit